MSAVMGSNQRSDRRNAARAYLCGRASDGAPLEPAPLAFGETAPDAEPLVVPERVLEALGSDLAAGADPLRLPGRTALLREERLGIGLGAQRPLLPGQLAADGVADHIGQWERQFVHELLLDPTPGSGRSP